MRPLREELAWWLADALAALLVLVSLPLLLLAWVGDRVYELLFGKPGR